MNKPYEKLIHTETTMTPGVFAAKVNGALRVELMGFNAIEAARMKLGSPENQAICVDREAAETLSNFFGDLATNLQK